MYERKQLFEFMIKRIKQTSDLKGDSMPQAFGRWFANMYFQKASDIHIPDGAGDGKVDLYLSSQVGKTRKYHILNTKYTLEYDKAAPVSFYDEITRFWQAFENKTNRHKYLENVVRENLKIYYTKLFKLYDEGEADLYFVTNHRINEKQFRTVENINVKIFHLDNVLQYMAEYIEGAMPETFPLLLTGISNVLTPATNETEVPTSIVFARLIDFIKYLEEDPFELLFARNVRLWLGKTVTNREIQETFKSSPKEFAFSNNGITILCKKHRHDPGTQELYLENPRVVNGSQTLHSIRNIENPSKEARVMVRIIEVPPINPKDLPNIITRRKEIIHKISIRSNMQNPIKKWNLVSNDDFQNELARYFWSKELYYERRQNEWNMRKLELRSLDIEKGPEIRWMTQLIAAHYYSNKDLGPANAYGNLGELFGEKSYSFIRDTNPEVAYQLYLLSEIIDSSLYELKYKYTYIKNVSGYIDLSLFTFINKLLDYYSVKWGNPGFTLALDKECNNPNRHWNDLAKCIVDYILKIYHKKSRLIEKEEDKELSYLNFFKNSSYSKSIYENIPLYFYRDIEKILKNAAMCKRI